MNLEIPKNFKEDVEIPKLLNIERFENCCCKAFSKINTNTVYVHLFKNNYIINVAILKDFKLGKEYNEDNIRTLARILKDFTNSIGYGYYTNGQPRLKKSL